MYQKYTKLDCKRFPRTFLAISKNFLRPIKSVMGRISTGKVKCDGTDFPTQTLLYARPPVSVDLAPCLRSSLCCYVPCSLANIISPHMHPYRSSRCHQFSKFARVPYSSPAPCTHVGSASALGDDSSRSRKRPGQALPLR